MFFLFFCFVLFISRSCCFSYFSTMGFIFTVKNLKKRCFLCYIHNFKNRQWFFPFLDIMGWIESALKWCFQITMQYFIVFFNGLSAFKTIKIEDFEWNLGGTGLIHFSVIMEDDVLWYNFVALHSSDCWFVGSDKVLELVLKSANRGRKSTSSVEI